MAMPAAAVTACCSAIPTSMRRSPKRSPNGMRPVEPGIAAVMATTSGRVLGLLDQRLGEGAGVQGGPPGTCWGPISGLKTGASWRHFSSSSSAGG